MNEQLQNPRQLRGIDIAKRYTLKEENGMWFVPSSSGKSERYKVCLKSQKCTCPDYEIRRQKCKHIFAAEYSFEKDFLTSLDTVEIAKAAKQRKTYRQVWTAYNKAQTTEKAEFQQLLFELCKGVGEPAQMNGRPRLALEDMIFACVYKVYSTFSGRRFITDLSEANKYGFISKVPNYNSIFNYFGMEMLTPYLKMLIEETSLPLKTIEHRFAVDASGLSTTQGFTWLHAKFTEPRLIDKRDWLKIHICTGVKTNIVSAVEVTERYEHDSHYFEPLIDATTENFEMKEVSADKAYLSKTNLQAAVNKNAVPFIAWKSNSRETDKPNNELWNKLYHWYALNQEKFFEHYHQRSNVETTFSMIKAKFGGSLRSKTRTAQINEALCKVLAHNICVLIQSMFELGLKPEFWRKIEAA
ncbi:MAG TPA: transposase [Pyrinomonadaceae bacterium]|jgi:transposase/predicted nucleic acid-binding Zn finger protein